MKIADYKIIFISFGLVSVLLFSYPSTWLVFDRPVGEGFSVLWVLGSERMAEGYPFNVSAEQEYLVYLGVKNQLGRSAYYMVEVKLRNNTEALPNATTGVPSPLPVLYTYRAFLQDGQVWEQPLSFSFSGVVFERAGLCMISRFSINGASVALNKIAFWDNTTKAYWIDPSIELFMELWLFNATSSNFSFDNRFVGVWISMTAGS